MLVSFQRMLFNPDLVEVIVPVATQANGSSNWELYYEVHFSSGNTISTPVDVFHDSIILERMEANELYLYKNFTNQIRFCECKENKQ